jgi:8-oxo-dGTP pyrophosphatase MutT (NUDIX family)
MVVRSRRHAVHLGASARILALHVGSMWLALSAAGTVPTGRGRGHDRLLGQVAAAEAVQVAVPGLGGHRQEPCVCELGVVGRSSVAAPIGPVRTRRGTTAAAGTVTILAMQRPMARTAAYRCALRLLRVWWAVRRPRSSGVRCILRHGDRVVLVRHTYGDRRWMLPGGRMRRGEEPVTTARREMQQELGITCGAWTVVDCLAARNSYRRRSRKEGFRRHSTFYVQGHVQTVTLTPRQGEIADADWFEAGALPDERSDSVHIAAGNSWLQAEEPRRGSAP